MAVDVPASWPSMVREAGGVPARRARTILQAHTAALVGAVNRLRSRCNGSVSWAGEASEAGASFVLALDGAWTLSPATSDGGRVALYAERAEVKVELDDGSTTSGVTLSTTGAGAQWVTGSLFTGATYAAGEELRLRVYIRASGGTARLYRVRVVEAPQTASDLR